MKQQLDYGNILLIFSDDSGKLHECSIYDILNSGSPIDEESDNEMDLVNAYLVNWISKTLGYTVGMRMKAPQKQLKSSWKNEAFTKSKSSGRVVMVSYNGRPKKLVKAFGNYYGGSSDTSY